MKTKKCSHCGEVKHELAFCGNKNSTDGIDWWCRACKNALARTANRRKARELGESPKKRKYWMAHFGPIQD